MAQHRPE